MQRRNTKGQTANPLLFFLCATWKVAVSMSLLTATSAWSKPVPGSLDPHWNEGASDCKATPQPPLQVHAYEPQTFILRQNPCADFEANFLYLLIGSDKALLSIPAPSRTRKRCRWRKRCWNYCRKKTKKSFHSWWHIPTGIWIIAPAILSSHLFHRFRSCPLTSTEFERFTVSLTGPTELLIWIWAAAL